MDRYIAVPAQALGYKMGELIVLDLRKRVRQHLGSRFNIRSFHGWVLGSGELPLDVLQQHVEREMVLFDSHG